MQKVQLVCSFCKFAPKARHPRDCHGYSACSQNHRPPSLAIPKSTRYWLEFRLIASFEPHCLMRSKNMGFWLTLKPAPEIAVDELGRLRKTRVNKALEDFDESLQSRVICVLEELHAIA